MSFPGNSVQTGHNLLPRKQAAGEPPEEVSHGQPAVESGFEPEAGVGPPSQALCGCPRPQLQLSRAKATRRKTSENCSHPHSVRGSEGERLPEPPWLSPARTRLARQRPRFLRRESPRHGTPAALDQRRIFRAGVREQASGYGQYFTARFSVA